MKKELAIKLAEVLDIPFETVASCVVDMDEAVRDLAEQLNISPFFPNEKYEKLNKILWSFVSDEEVKY